MHSYQKAEVIYDLTFRFCERFLKRGDRTIDQMVQAARSGKLGRDGKDLYSIRVTVSESPVARAWYEAPL